MNWDDLLGHTQQRGWFETALEKGRLASSFLFVGRDGIGKRTFARLLAKSLLCRQSDPNRLEHCGHCDDCTQVDASTHPDLIELSKPADKAFLPVELLIGEREKRMREGLCHEISLRPYGGRRKIAIIDDADTLNAEGANCLLKTLEEPPADSLLILISGGLQRQLPTIRSRCQAILFRPLTTEQVAQLLPAVLPGEPDGSGFSDEQVQQLARQSEGSLAVARMLADDAMQQFQAELLGLLAGPEVPINELIKTLSGIVDGAGKDNRVKRDRMRVVFQLAGAFYRGLCLTMVPGAAVAGEQLRLAPQAEQAIAAAIHNGYSAQAAMRCWNRCLTAIEQVDRNANQAGLIEAWSMDMAALSGH